MIMSNEKDYRNSYIQLVRAALNIKINNNDKILKETRESLAILHTKYEKLLKKYNNLEYELEQQRKIKEST